MAAISRSVWTTILAVAGILLVVGMFVSGQLLIAVPLLVLLIVFGGGAMLYRRSGPPSR